VVGKHGFFVAAGEWVRNSQTPRMEIRPLEAGNLAELEIGYIAFATSPADSELAGWIRYLSASRNARMPSALRAGRCHRRNREKLNRNRPTPVKHSRQCESARTGVSGVVSRTDTNKASECGEFKPLE